MDKQIFAGINSFEKKELKKVKTEVRHIGYIIDRALDNKLAKVIDGLFIGSADGAANLDELKEHKIKTIINLAPGAAKNFFPNFYKYKTVEALDVPHFNLAETFDDCVDFIIDTLVNEGSCLVHCNAG